MALARTRLFSDALGLCVTVDVILPQRRDNAVNHKLPVLWLLHGAFGNHADWIRRTSIERYVAPYGLAVVMPSAQNSCYCDMAHGGKYYTFISKELPKKLRSGPLTSHECKIPPPSRESSIRPGCVPP